MHGFKNSTRTQYFKGGEAKVGKVMGEFKAGTLHSGSKKGPAVENPKQAIAIALSEARKAGAKVPVKKARGGEVRQEASDKTVSVQRPMSAQTTVETRRAMAVKRAKDSAPKREALIPSRAGYGDEALVQARKPKTSDPMHGTNGYKRGGEVKAKAIVPDGVTRLYGQDPRNKGTYKFKNGEMDPTEARVSRDITSRDEADIRRGSSPKASKLDKMAMEQAIDRQNRMGIANRGFNDDTGRGFKRGGKVVEKGSNEVYASKAAMAKHEAKESKSQERKEHRKQMGGPVYPQDAQMLANDAAGLKAMSGYRKGGKVPC